MSGFWRTAIACLAILICIETIGLNSVYSRLPPDAANAISALRRGELSRLDRAALERGYYEDLQRIDRFNGALWEVYQERPADWMDVPGSGLTKFTGDFLTEDLRPSFVARTSWGDMTTNRWGLRDRDYEQVPRENTFRAAMLGASVTMGWGVLDDETFEQLVEDRLNREISPETGLRYEILNFAAHNYSPLQQMASFERAIEFGLDAVILAAHRRETERAAEYLVKIVDRGVEIPYTYLRDLLTEAGVEDDTSAPIAARLLQPYEEDILAWAYGRIVELAEANGILPVFAMFDEQPGITDEKDMTVTLGIAERAGFVTLDLRNVFDGYAPEEIRLAEWDRHPNALGHQLVADRLFTALVESEPPLLPTP